MAYVSNSEPDAIELRDHSSGPLPYDFGVSGWLWLREAMMGSCVICMAQSYPVVAFGDGARSSRGSYHANVPRAKPHSNSIQIESLDRKVIDSEML
jgi:hypothetical protein